MVWFLFGCVLVDLSWGLWLGFGLQVPVGFALVGGLRVGLGCC